ncbi:MAG: ABC transporter ATP-binding protein [Eubacteriales bacterium]|nr:ABC transporter ATP-binding protein [Eubacteriales bacterium]
MNPIISLKNVSYSYHTLKGEIPALADISFQLQSGSFTSIVGPSGCGKTTLLSLISGILTPESGTVEISSEKNICIGYMLQRDNLFEWRSVYKNMLLGLEIQKKCDSKHIENVNNLMDTYGLTPFKHAKPSQLSGGMRQRAALIRTLALEPEVLLLDEPFSALDYQTRLQVSDDIYQIIQEQHKTAVLVTHDISEAISMGDHVIVLSGRPATISRVFPISLTTDKRTPITSRFAPEFKDYFNEIWEEMK